MPLFHKKSSKANITPPPSYENNNMSAVNNHHNHHQQPQLLQQQQQQKSVRYQEHHHLPHHPISPPPAYSNCQVEATIPRPQLIFHCQLAQGSPTGLITGFASVKELYQKIAECYDFPVDEVS